MAGHRGWLVGKYTGTNDRGGYIVCTHHGFENGGIAVLPKDVLFKGDVYVFRRREIFRRALTRFHGLGGVPKRRGVPWKTRGKFFDLLGNSKSFREGANVERGKCD
jgi:hypothetical protein